MKYKRYDRYLFWTSIDFCEDARWGYVILVNTSISNTPVYEPKEGHLPVYNPSQAMPLVEAWVYEDGFVSVQYNEEHDHVQNGFIRFEGKDEMSMLHGVMEEGAKICLEMLCDGRLANDFKPHPYD
ncbi:MAG TPA: hypothetical protein DCE42_17775 [Myxococcales bacterium]|nr:hypothetical protein [Deltaproteobacteria bacterium]MBU54201.1 hypothetical protein [Deltaproteobacteria bacterium]HAA56618.1 hypothetical protein [Myxococcales bacterium]|tara:strand:+ start:209 stop:586 length:378 start_codon:yes stop_codon:yes gene_type:complete